MFRRSGSVVSYYVAGDLGDPRAESFAAALAKQRFRTIEQAASEETSFGWVTANDPTGDSFEFDDLDLDRFVWLRMRVDTKRLPSTWLRIHRSVAERGAGRPLSVRERRELRDDLCRKLLPRTLPAVQFIDALWHREERRVLLFATSTRLREAFESLFVRTFAQSLEQAGPLAIAERAKLDAERQAYLAEVSPVPWPRERRGRAPRRAATEEAS